MKIMTKRRPELCNGGGAWEIEVSIDPKADNPHGLINGSILVRDAGVYYLWFDVITQSFGASIQSSDIHAANRLFLKKVGVDVAVDQSNIKTD